MENIMSSRAFGNLLLCLLLSLQGISLAHANCNEHSNDKIASGVVVSVEAPHEHCETTELENHPMPADHMCENDCNDCPSASIAFSKTSEEQLALRIADYPPYVDVHAAPLSEGVPIPPDCA
jgi:hypothetical protein